jgi:hypothetical protein
MNLLKQGKSPPFVTVNGRLIQAGGKLSERVISQELERLDVAEGLTSKLTENKA